MHVRGAILLVGVCFVAVTWSRKLPSFITPCKRGDPDIPKCWANVVEQMRPYIKTGIPEMGIPPCDPLVIPRLEMSQPDGASIGFNAVLTNLTFQEGLNFKMSNIQVDLDKNFFYMEINFPRLLMRADYKAQGKILLVNFEGEGYTNGEFKNVTLYATYHDERINKNGKQYLHVASKIAKVGVGSIQIYFDNLFKNNPAITENTNKLINENTELLFSEIKPIIEQTIGDLVTSVINTVNERYSIDDLFPK